MAALEGGQQREGEDRAERGKGRMMGFCWAAPSAGGQRRQSEAMNPSLLHDQLRGHDDPGSLRSIKPRIGLNL